MLTPISGMIRHIAGTEGDVVKKFQPSPKIKPPRRKPSVHNKSNRTDYMKNYMSDYRKDQGKDYQKVPSSVKKFRAKQRERLKKKFNLKKACRDPEKSLDDMMETLTTAFAYMPPDGTAKLCGDRCALHVEEGPNKDRCLILGPDVFVPNVASCNYYVKGPAADPDSRLDRAVEPYLADLVYGCVQCKRCNRANEDASVCLFLTSILNKVFGKEGQFKIQPDGCCSAQRGKQQEAPRFFR